MVKFKCLEGFRLFLCLCFRRAVSKEKPEPKSVSKAKVKEKKETGRS